MVSQEKSQPIYSPILKWPGGKRWLAPQISHLLASEINGHYFEPFLGGGAMFLSVQPESAILSDINSDLIDFYATCTEHAESVVDRARQFRNIEEDYYRVRRSKPTSQIGKAARFLYLNRTCWGGLYRLNGAGQFNVPFGHNNRKLCTKTSIIETSKIFGKAELLSSDFEGAFDKAVSGDVIFADPPYTSRGQNNGFVRYNESLFSWKDQLRLSRRAKAARRKGVFVAVCGPMHSDILELYSGWLAVKVARHSSIARKIESRKALSECVILSRSPKYKPENIFRISEPLIQSISKS